MLTAVLCYAQPLKNGICTASKYFLKLPLSVMHIRILPVNKRLRNLGRIQFIAKSSSVYTKICLRHKHKTGFIQTWQNKIPWHFPDFSLTPIQISLTEPYSPEKVGFIQTFVYSYSLQLFFSILSDNYELCKVFIQAFQHVYLVNDYWTKKIQIVTVLYICWKLLSPFKNLDVDL